MENSEAKNHDHMDTTDEKSPPVVLSNSPDRIARIKHLQNDWVQIEVTRRTKKQGTMQTNFINLSPIEIDALYDFLSEGTIEVEEED